METGKTGVRSLSFVLAIGVVLLLHSGVAEADNPCYEHCFRMLCAPMWFSPAWVASCAATCAAGDTCEHSSLLPSSKVTSLLVPGGREQENAIHYCKLRCASSVCSTISATLNLDSSADHVGEEASIGSVERCNNACSGLCTGLYGRASPSSGVTA